MKPDPTVLVIDNDKATRRLLRNILEPQGYRVCEAADGARGLAAATGKRPDLIILEVALPDLDGVKVLQSLREWSQTPVLVLSERRRDEDKVTVLDNGADDYMAKPFSSAELQARLRVLRRQLRGVPEGPFLVEGELLIDLATHRITVGGRPVKLTPKEETLLYVLARYAGKIVTHAHLVRSIWGNHSDERIQDLRVLVSHLRKKLVPFAGELVLRTEGSLGYSLAPSAKPKRAVCAVNGS